MKRFLLLFVVLFAALKIQAQTQTAQVLLGTQGSPAILTDSIGRIYFAAGKLICRYQESTRKLDTLYTHQDNNNWAISGITMGAGDSVIYFTKNDTIFSLGIQSRRRQRVWSGYEYPTVLAYRKSDGMIYATEVGFDNGRAPSLAKYDPVTNTRTFIAGEARRNQPNVANYVNDTASKARFNFPRPNGSFRNKLALAFDNTGDTLLIAESDNRCIRWVNVNNGVVGTYAGRGPNDPTSPLFRDSSRYLARFNDPYGITVLANGDVLVADNGAFSDTPVAGNRIRKISARRDTVYTIAGNGRGQGAGQYNNMDYTPGIGAQAWIGQHRGMGISKNQDTVYVSLVQRTIKLTKRKPSIGLSPLSDILTGAGSVALTTSKPQNLTTQIALVSAPQGVTLSNDSLIVPASANTGLVRLALSTPGDEDDWLPATDTFTIRVVKPQTLTLRKIRDYKFGASPFAVVDSTQSNIAGQPTFIRVVRITPANAVTFDTTTQVFTINGACQVIYKGVALGNDSTQRVEILDTFIVNKAGQRLVYTPVPDKVFGDAPFSLSASAVNSETGLPSGQNATINVVALGSVASYNSGTQLLTINGAGQVIVRVNAASNTNYDAATEILDTFQITRRAQVLSVDSVPDLMVGSGFYTIVASTASPNSGVALQYSLTTAPQNVVLATGPARINVPASALTGPAVLRVIQPGNNNHLPDTVYRNFNIIQQVGIASSLNTQVVNVYPNPNLGSFKLTLPTEIAMPVAKLYNSTGQVIDVSLIQISANIWQVDNQALPAGTYKLLVQDGNNHYKSTVNISR